MIKNFITETLPFTKIKIWVFKIFRSRNEEKKSPKKLQCIIKINSNEKRNVLYSKMRAEK